MRIGLLVASTGALVGGCMTVPALEYDGAGISEIVQRIKCELAFALPDFKSTFPSGPFQWMYYWTAKIDLELATTDTSSLSTGASFIFPANSFALNAGGGLSGTAYRNDKVSFTVSMNELADAKYRGECDLPRRVGLLGKLGLEEWIKSALAPVAQRQLTIGYHAPPTGKSVRIPGPLAPFAARSIFDDALAFVKFAEGLAEKARHFSDIAKKAALKKQMQSTYDAVEKAYAYAGETTTQLDLARTRVWKGKRQILDKEPPEEITAADKAVIQEIADRTKEAEDQAKKARDFATAAWNLLPLDPPLDSITHSVKFTVVANANATPNWTLVRFRGPGLAPPFVYAQRTRVHNLDVVLGAPLEPGGKALSDEQRRQLLNLRLDSLRVLSVPIQ